MWNLVSGGRIAHGRSMSLSRLGSRGRSTTLSVAEEGGDSRQVRGLGKCQVTLDDGICRKCNGDRLGGLEHAGTAELEPMAVRGERVMLRPG